LVSLIKRSGASPARRNPAVEVKAVELDPLQAASSTDPLNEADPDDPVARARREAEIIVRTARSEAESVLEEARAEGCKMGLADAAGVTDELIGRIEAMLAEVVAQRNALIDEVEPQLLKLVIQVVEKVIRHEIRTDPCVVERAIKSCLKRVKDSNEVWVRVSPEEVERVKAVRDELLSAADGMRELHIADDRRVEAGGCVVESSSGSFDARVATQLSRLRDKLMEAFENGRRESEPGPDEIQRDDQQNGHDQR
jgi:flagellar assembly protein FliH